MNDPMIALNKVKLILLDWDKNNEASHAYFASCKAILRELDGLSKENNLSDYTGEKLVNLNWHINAMFECDIDNGHDFSKHLTWALGEVQSLTSTQCFGTLNSG